MPDGWEYAAETCATVFVLDQIIQEGGVGYDAERVSRIPEEINLSSQRASMQSPEYEELSSLVLELVYAIQRGDEDAIMDLVAVEAECEVLGFGAEPPQ